MCSNSEAKTLSKKERNHYILRKTILDLAKVVSVQKAYSIQSGSRPPVTSVPKTVFSDFTLGLYREIEFELCRELIFRVEAVCKVHPANAAVGMNLYPEGLHIVGAIGPAGEISQVELYLVPSLIQPHGHSADEWLHPRCALEIARSEPTSHILVVQDLHFEREILLHVFNNHDEIRKADAQRFSGISGACDEGRADIGSKNLEHEGLNVIVCDALDMPVAYLFIPYLERFAADTVQD